MRQSAPLPSTNSRIHQNTSPDLLCFFTYPLDKACLNIVLQILDPSCAEIMPDIVAIRGRPCKKHGGLLRVYRLLRIFPSAFFPSLPWVKRNSVRSGDRGFVRRNLTQMNSLLCPSGEQAIDSEEVQLAGLHSFLLKLLAPQRVATHLHRESNVGRYT